MSGIAEVLCTLGYQVTGSDLRSTDVTEHLKRLGGTVFIGHAAENITGAHVVVTSTVSTGTIPRCAPRKRRRSR
jgi:UDP-N-acetylmuramate--alanine ligase